MPLLHLKLRCCRSRAGLAQREPPAWQGSSLPRQRAGPRDDNRAQRAAATRPAPGAGPFKQSARTRATASQTPCPSIPVTRQLAFAGGAAGAAAPKLPCYRALDAAGRPLEGAAVPHPLDKDQALQLYSTMARMQVCNASRLRRQGRGAALARAWPRGAAAPAGLGRPPSGGLGCRVHLRMSTTRARRHTYAAATQVIDRYMNQLLMP